MTRNEIEMLAKRAQLLKPGVNNKWLKDLDGSWAPYLRFLYLAVKTFQPKVALDLGTSGDFQPRTWLLDTKILR